MATALSYFLFDIFLNGI